MLCVSVVALNRVSLPLISVLMPASDRVYNSFPLTLMYKIPPGEVFSVPHETAPSPPAFGSHSFQNVQCVLKANEPGQIEWLL